MSPLKLSSGVAIATLLCTSVILAQNGSSYYTQDDSSYNTQSGFYVAANVGGAITIPAQGKSSIYKKGGVGQLIGYQWSDHWAAEIGALFLNESSSDISSPVLIDSIGYVAVKGISPFSNNSSLFCKLGWGMQTIPTLSIDSDDDTVSQVTHHKGGLFIGPGVELSLTKNLGLTVEYDAIISKNVYVVNEKNPNKMDKKYSITGLLGLGLVYHFTV